MKVQKSRINMLDALQELSPEAYYLLNVLYLDNIPDVKDSTLLDKVPYGERAYKKYKAELVDKKYLKVVQTGRHKYKYILGKSKIESDEDKYELKYITDSMLEGRKILEMRELTKEEVEETRASALDVYERRKNNEITI